MAAEDWIPWEGWGREHEEHDPEPAELECPDCHGPMVFVTAEESRWGKPFYRCDRWPKCHGHHGAHPDGSPLGIPADARTRALRKQAHDALDPLWRDAPLLYGADALDPKKAIRLQQVARGRVYDWLEWELGEPVHLGSADAALCHRVIFAASKMNAERVRAWAKAEGKYA